MCSVGGDEIRSKTKRANLRLVSSYCVFGLARTFGANRGTVIYFVKEGFTVSIGSKMAGAKELGQTLLEMIIMMEMEREFV